MVFSKHVRDYIWDIEQTFPGVKNCKVINIELMKINGTYMIPEKNHQTGMKSFSSWKEISDHYPIFMQFQGWNSNDVKVWTSSLTTPIQVAGNGSCI